MYIIVEYLLHKNLFYDNDLEIFIIYRKEMLYEKHFI